MIIIIIDKKKKKKKKGNPQDETQSLTKCLNMDIWVTGTLSQLFVRVCHNAKRSPSPVFPLYFLQT